MHHIELNVTNGVSSYDHPMHGGFLYSWFTCLAGIEPLSPGFRSFKIKPCHAKSVTRLAVSIESPYGMIEVVYNKRTDGPGYRYTVTVPANTQAVFEAPGLEAPILLGSGTWMI